MSSGLRTGQVPHAVVGEAQQPDARLLDHVVGELLQPRAVVHPPGVLMVVVEEGDGEDPDGLVDRGDGAVMGHGHLQRAEPEPLHGGLVLPELAGRENLDLDGATGRLFHMLLEGERGDVLGLVVLGRLEVGVLQDLLRVGRRHGEYQRGDDG
jgi:hypothetical protein